MRPNSTIIWFSLLAGVTTPVSADLEWRVSVKFVYDQQGNPPGSNPQAAWIDTPEEVNQYFDYANDVLDRLGRGYRFRVVEIVDLTNPPPPPAGATCCVGGENDAEACLFAFQ